MIDDYRYDKSVGPTVTIDEDEMCVDLVCGSCCFDCHIESMTPQKAQMLGYALLEIAKELRRIEREEKQCTPHPPS